jgi:exopolysaccharide biosynthesis polyprenyl glycosylphosphotransferase
MASPDLSQWFPARSEAGDDYGLHRTGVSSAGRNHSRTVTLLWMLVDVLTVGIATAVATYLRKIDALSYFDHRAPLHANPSALLLYLAGFSIILVIVGQTHGLYGPLQAFTGLREQRLTVQTCFTASLILAGALYFSRADSISRAVVVATVILTTLLLGVRRALWRYMLYKRYEKGLDTRNVLVIGTGSSGLAIRSHLQRIRHLGFTFKGFVRTGRDRMERGQFENSPFEGGPYEGGVLEAAMLEQTRPPEILGDLPELGDLIRRHFIDEIFITGPCERGVVKRLIAQASVWGIDVRVVPDLYDGLAWSAPIEYVGQFPTMPLHRHHMPVVGMLLKRVLDVVISSIAIVLLSPLILLLAIAIRIDSKGPVFYCSERIGRKGRTFGCWKFRTMVADAESLREQFSHKNERDGVLFKIAEDPRVTRLGRLLRKYSLDELPQFFNVLAGHMSIVGPRPPLAGEVRQYELSHLRRLEVLPGITGLWQVQARQDPSFDQYISLDTAYIDNWSIWLDIKIMTRTVGVLLNGTGA